MARRAFPLGLGAVTAGLGLFLLGPLAAVMWRADQGFSRFDLAAVSFTFWQAALSAALSMALAVPVARALFRRRFLGRSFVISILGAPFLLPVIVAVLGLLSIFGRAGLLAAIAAKFGVTLPPIYGAGGVILAHVFLNMPFGVRLLLLGWQGIPSERFRLAQSLGFVPKATFLHLEWPMLRLVLPGALMAIFVICLSSFAVALTLGGGPRATTVELSIYQALRFDFNLGAAATLAIMQFALCLAALFLSTALPVQHGFGRGLDREVVLQSLKGWRRWADFVLLLMAMCFLLLPLGGLFINGFWGLSALPAPIWLAALRSVGVALCAAFLACLLAFVLARASLQFGRSFDAVAMLPLATSSLVLGTGIFLIIHPFISPAKAALVITILTNGCLSLPFAFRILLPDLRRIYEDYGRQIALYGLEPWAALRFVIWPRMRRAIGFAMGVTAALSMGDLGVITLFASQDGATLPMMIARLLGAYKMETAASASLFLVILTFGIFWLFDYGGRRHAQD
ncbi:MAG: thiamine/thiamine pyrophosphate ABC transporter permease ThiP [Paracoccaceae bacterium]|jgi:thiamine transport system permease protein